MVFTEKYYAQFPFVWRPGNFDIIREFSEFSQIKNEKTRCSSIVCEPVTFLHEWRSSFTSRAFKFNFRFIIIINRVKILISSASKSACVGKYICLRSRVFQVRFPVEQVFFFCFYSFFLWLFFSRTRAGTQLVFLYKTYRIR